jgi:beta-xylosidase
MTSPAHRLSALLLALTLLPAACSVRQAAATPLPASETPSPTATLQPDTATPAPTATAAATSTASATPYPVFWDDFTGEFRPGWTWIRENDALWSLTSVPGSLRIVLEGAKLPRNLLVRMPDSENFQITTHLRFEPTSNFQGAGLIVYLDDGNWLSLGRAYCDIQNSCVGNGVYFDRVRDGQFTGSNFGADTQLKDEAYLRIDKEGSLFTAYYSDDGAEWQTIGQHEVPTTDPKVGLTTGGSHIVGAIALFDYFGLQGIP